MPRNFKEAMIFTCLMCSMMVFGMSAWNLFVAGHLSLVHITSGFVPGFVVAFLLDVLIVGPIAKKVAISLLTHMGHHEKRWAKIIAISGTMAICMVTLMSFFGLFMNGVGVTPASYGNAWLTNLVMALPLNFIVAGPISRFILGRIQKASDGEAEIEDFDDDEEIPTII